MTILARASVRETCRPLLLGHIEALRERARLLELDIALEPVADAAEGFARPSNSPVPVLELETATPAEPIGAPSASFGMASVEGVLRAGQLCIENTADAMVTPPISKESMHLANYPYEGQTQILGELCRSRRYGMLACSGPLRILVATRHMALRKAIERLEASMVVKQLRLAHEAAREVLGIREPRIALAGLNPHAGENGAFGNEERKHLAPAIARARDELGFETAGPCVPDVVFREGYEGKWDIVVALYHDQAFIPLKMLDRRRSYTLFVGGPILRVSPMHGTAFDLAGSGKADVEPFAHALETALEIHRARAVVA